VYSFKELLRVKLSESSIYRKLNVSLLSDQSCQFLSKTIFGYGEKNLFDLSIWEAPIDQIDSQILNPKSLFNNNNFDITIVFESSHSLLKKYNSTQNKETFSGEQFIRFKELIEELLRSSKTKVILFNFYELNDQVFGNFSSKTINSFIYQLRRLNFLISEFTSTISRISILDISSIQNKIGSKNMFDSSLFVNYGMVLNLDSNPIISKNIIDIISSYNSIFKKCIILDLDNTLWGGIIGDDGIENIKLGNLGIGKSFVDFQYWIKKLKDRGIIICVCSKNNEDVSRNVFINHPDMVLLLDDISLFVSNWDSKVDNIKNIQKTLNIGFDSMVFIDDNPYERNSVKDNIPFITVPDLPKDPSNYVSFLSDENLFETVTSSNIDKDRTKLYQTEYKRVKSRSNFTDLSDYMINLDMKSKVELLNSFNIPRVSQLSQRSNQFNLRTIRYEEDELIQIMNSKDYYGVVFDLKDKFGDHGIISFLILQKTKIDEVFIENWAMSCRVLERGMENFIINYLQEFCESQNIYFITSEYLESPKNSLVKNLYDKLGFEFVENKYSLNINNLNNLDTKIKIDNGKK
jgi:FkbH-like protein